MAKTYAVIYDLLANMPAAGVLNREFQATDGAQERYRDTGAEWVKIGTLDHGGLSGLSDDGHPQYHNDARGDARYAFLVHKGRHATGGADPLAPADIGAASTGRLVSTGAGLTGGGDLSADRTLVLRSYAYFEAQANGVSTSLPNQSWTTIGLGATNVDAEGVFNVSTYRFTAPRAGVYFFSGSVHFDGGVLSAGNSVLLGLSKNQQAAPGILLAGPHAGGTSQMQINGVTTIILAAGDTIELKAWQNTGAAAPTSGGANKNFLYGAFWGA